MPHNLFLHSEIIQSRQWSLADDAVIQKQLKYEFRDTLFSMIIGWAINSAMILMAAASFYQNGNGTTVDDLAVTGSMLAPLAWKYGITGLCSRSAAFRDFFEHHSRNGRRYDFFRYF